MEHKMIKRASLWIFPLLLAWCVALGMSAKVASAEELVAGTPDIQPVEDVKVDVLAIDKAETKVDKCEDLLDGVKSDAKRLDKKKAKKKYAKIKKNVGSLKKMAKEKPYLATYRDQAKKIQKKASKQIKKISKGLRKQASNARYLKFHGVVYSGGLRYTWYSQNVLPGGGLSIPGRHVGNAGLIMDKDNYVCVASETHSKHTVLKTPYGMAKVYDSGCDYGTVDVYTNW